MTPAEARLVTLLRAAYAGELAAALAYRGHWRSLREPRERANVRRIELEEWDHRRRVGRMLGAMGVRSAVYRDQRARLIGTIPLTH